MYCSLVEDRIGSHYMTRGQYDHTMDGHGPSVVVYDKQQTMGVYSVQRLFEQDACTEVYYLYNTLFRTCDRGIEVQYGGMEV